MNYATPAILFTSAFLLGGCLVASSNRTDEYGTRVSDATLQQVESGKTTEQWLIATLGEPTSSRVVDDSCGHRVHRYEYRVERESSGAVFLIYAGESETVERTNNYFEVKDGIVIKHWCDGELNSHSVAQ